MYSFLTSAIKPETNYQWFTHNGKTVTVYYRDKPIEIRRGMRYGVRPSSNGKNIRLVFPNEITRVITIDLPTAKALAKGVKAEG